MEKEIWKDIKDYEGIYQVSNYGKIKSLRFNRVICTSKCGYEHTKLSKNGIKRDYNIHRLVAIAFIPNPNNYPQINHKDGNKLNNCVDNLEWCSASYNNIHAIRNGLRTYKDKEKPILQIKNNIIIKEYKSLSECCRQNNYDRGTISNCALHKKRHKTAYGFKWEYKENYQK